MNTDLKILCYHGVTSEPSSGIINYSRKHISEQEFEKQMHYLKVNCNVLSIDDVVNFHNSRIPYPNNSVVVTFDDGFRNNFTKAVPILKKYNIPATFYITSGIVNTDIMFWVDRLENSINCTAQNSLDLQSFGLGTFELHNYSSKIFALDQIKLFCKSQPNQLKDKVIESVEAQCGYIPSNITSDYYTKISWPELKKISDDPLFTIGGHSLYHDILTSYSGDDSRLIMDIEISIKLLEFNLKTPIHHYSYPEGQAIHFNEKIISILKSFGIICCPSGIFGTNSLDDELFKLKRVMVGFNKTEFPFIGYE